MKNLIKEHLGLSNVNIEKVETTKRGHIEITVKSTLQGTRCHRCQQKIIKPYGSDRLLRLRHLPLFGKPVYIYVRLPRYQCDNCDKMPKTTQRPDWHKKNSSFTIPYEKHILLSAINSTETDVAHKEGVTEEQVKGIVNRHIDSQVDWEKIDTLSILGIDEISLRKGHQSFIVVISALNEGKLRIISLLKGRKKETVKAFLSSIPEKLKSTVRWVCTDMYDGYINASKEVFGQSVHVVIDRFHVAKLYRSKLDNLRKKEMKRLKKSLSDAEYKNLKGAMWALRYSPSNLSEHYKSVLDRIFRRSRVLEDAYTYSTQLTTIFNESVSKASGIRRIKSWIKSVEASSLTCFSTFIKTLQQHFEDIANYFVLRLSSAFVEGLNNKIKVIKRRCYGIFNLKPLFQRIFLDIHAYTTLN